MDDNARAVITNMVIYKTVIVKEINNHFNN